MRQEYLHIELECESHYFEGPGEVMFLQRGSVSPVCRGSLCSPAVPQLGLEPPLLLCCLLAVRLLASGPCQLHFTILDICKRRSEQGGEGYGQGTGLRRQYLKVRFGNVQEVRVLNFISFIHLHLFLPQHLSSSHNKLQMTPDRVGGLCKHSQIRRL